MFQKIEELSPTETQYIAFKSADMVFAGYYLGDSKAKPFSISGKDSPIFVISEWMPLQLWA